MADPRKREAGTGASTADPTVSGEFRSWSCTQDRWEPLPQGPPSHTLWDVSPPSVTRGSPGAATHQLDALREGVVLPVLLREALQDLSLPIPAPCGDKMGLEGSRYPPHPRRERRAGTTPGCSSSPGTGQRRRDPGPSPGTAGIPRDSQGAGSTQLPQPHLEVGTALEQQLRSRSSQNFLPCDASMDSTPRSPRSCRSLLLISLPAFPQTILPRDLLSASRQLLLPWGFMERWEHSKPSLAPQPTPVQTLNP